MSIKTFFQTNSVSKIIGGLGILLIALVIFQAGAFVGYHKGAFSSNWNNNYMMRDADDPRSFFAPFMHRGDDINPHGAVGEIVSMNLPLVMIKGPNRAEEVIIVGTSTTIRNFRQTVSASDLSIGSQVVVIGEPNDKGQIQAELVRIMPTPPSGFPPMMSSSSPRR
ncbi:MAG: hypothetical protein WCS89_04090 [Candidatus Paceibacterota bacterium]